MSGIEFNEDMTSEQLSAFSGGEILKSEVQLGSLNKLSGKFEKRISNMYIFFFVIGRLLHAYQKHEKI